MSSAFSPFQYRVFTFLWIASVASNIGTWMHEVGAGWLMLQISGDPLMVSLVAASASLPVFLFVLIAGALADIFDRRKYLLCTQIFLVLFATGLTLLTAMGLMTPWLLLFFTFAIGTGAAFMMPAWDAIVTELVPRKDLPQAVSLGSIGVNTARAVGPALAGLIISIGEIYYVFLINTISFIGVIVALIFWKREVPQRGMATERFVGSLKAGLRFVAHTKGIQTVLKRAVLFFTPAIALLSLLPIYVSQTLQADAKVLGFLQGSMGLGAIISALLMPNFKRYFSKDQLLLGSAFTLALAYLALGLFQNVALGCVALFFGGVAWITAFSIIRVTAQQAVPDWVRARAMSMVLMVSFGSMTLGSTAWGQSVNLIGLQETLFLIAAIAVGFALLALNFPLASVKAINTEEAEDYQQHEHFLYQPNEGEGPIQVSIQYSVKEKEIERFLESIQKLKEIRQRNGAYQWNLFLDLEKTRVYVEDFLVENWAEHERQHNRTGKDEKAIHSEVFSCCEEAQPPMIRHLLHVTN
jgi:MFS family permease